MRLGLGLSTLLGLALGSAGAWADEGQWTPDQLSKLDAEALRAAGLALDPAELWNEAGTGRLRAAVNYAGCSGGFVSPEGLMLTNHHCAYGAIQAQSKPERDLLKNGFLARERKDELPALGRNKLWVVDRIEDVSERVRARVQSEADPVRRHLEVERLRKQLARDCEAGAAGVRCQVEEFFLGAEYRLFRYLELRDLRLVYAPPSSIGEYGGEIDNWMWPRHTGDFALLRAYVSPSGESADFDERNVPYRPAVHFPVSTEGVSPGAFVMVVGYPGRTYRYLPAAEVTRQLDQVLPRVVSLYGEWIDILEAQGKRARAVEIKVAATKKALANRKKNAEGMISGLKTLGLFARRQAEEAALAAWAETAGEPFTTVLPELEQLSAERRRSFERDFFLETAPRVSNLLGLGVDLVRRAREARKDDLDRVEAYRDRNERDLRLANERRLRDFDPKVEQAMLESILGHGDALLGEGSGGETRSKGVVATTRAFVASILKDSTLHRPEVLKTYFEARDAEALERSKDPMLELAHRFVLELEAKEAEEGARAGRLILLGPKYVEMLEAVRKSPVYPDANGTLRFSYAKVTGYSPRDGLFATPQTSLGGAVAKHTGQEPFTLPAPVLAKAELAPGGRWADPQLEDVPTCFLSNADTTGGNSGSPVLNGKGQLVGLNFDRVWENIAGDFGYSPERSRNISVDVRFMLYLLDQIEGASELLTELGVQPAPASAPEAARRDVAPGAASPASVEGGCRCEGAPPSPPARTAPAEGIALLVLLAVRRRRRSEAAP